MREQYLFPRGYGEFKVLDSEEGIKVVLPGELMGVLETAWAADKDNRGKLFLEKDEYPSRYYHSFGVLSETRRRLGVGAVVADKAVVTERMFRPKEVLCKEGNLPLPVGFRDVERIYWGVKDNPNYFIVSENIDDVITI